MSDSTPPTPPASGGGATPAGCTTAPCPNCTVGSVTLTVSKTPLTLKHDREADIEMVVSPASASVSAQRIEIQRQSGGAWCTLDTAMSIKPWQANIAGLFNIRGVVTVCGTDHISNVVPIEVRFPTYTQIEGDAAVRTATDATWASTKSDATATRRRERGYYVLLNTTTNAYVMGAEALGSWRANHQGASVNITGRTDTPAAPAPCDAGARYFVASFHTHTPTANRPGPGTRGVGPSGADQRVDTAEDIPGIVYDYTESPAGSGSIPMGHPLNSAAQRYHSAGKTRRTTPP